eukprot:762163-Hanusia_phi.AAC.3
MFARAALLMFKPVMIGVIGCVIFDFRSVTVISCRDELVRFVEELKKMEIISIDETYIVEKLQEGQLENITFEQFKEWSQGANSPVSFALALKTSVSLLQQTPASSSQTSISPLTSFHSELNPSSPPFLQTSMSRVSPIISVPPQVQSPCPLRLSFPIPCSRPPPPVKALIPWFWQTEKVNENIDPFGNSNVLPERYERPVGRGSGMWCNLRSFKVRSSRVQGIPCSRKKPLPATWSAMLFFAHPPSHSFDSLGLVVLLEALAPAAPSAK